MHINTDHCEERSNLLINFLIAIARNEERMTSQSQNKIANNSEEPGTCFPLYLFLRFATKKDAAANRGTSFDDSNKNDKIEESIRAMRLGF